jgi:hypothetical protein
MARGSEHRQAVNACTWPMPAVAEGGAGLGLNALFDGEMPPVDAEDRYDEQLEPAALAAGLRENRAGSHSD